MDIKEIGETVGAASAVGGIIWAIWSGIKAIWPRFRNWMTRSHRIEAMLESVSTNVDNIKNNHSILSDRTNMLFFAQPVAILEFSSSGVCLMVNPSCCRLFKEEEDDLLDNGWLRAIDESERDKIWNSWSTACKYNLPFSTTFKLSKSDRTVHCVGTHMKDSGNRYIVLEELT